METVKTIQMGADPVFCPDPQEMYQGHKIYIKVEDLSSKLCGKNRPIHFRGVCTVCAKFFNITQADRAYYGWKDAQQLLILKKMVKDLNMNIELVGMPIVREEDGLAKSSSPWRFIWPIRRASLITSAGIPRTRTPKKRSPPLYTPDRYL